MKPTIAVVIPAYNAEAWIAETLASVHAQSRAPQEIIVVDDGSRDATAQVAAANGARVVRRPNGGAAAARNCGIAAATSDWIAFLDADDLWLPARVERLEAALLLCPDVSAIFADYYREEGGVRTAWFEQDRHYHSLHGREISPGLRRFARGELVDALVRSREFLFTSALAVRRRALLDSGGYCETLSRAEDLEMMLRLLVHTTAAAIEEPLSVYRPRSGGLTSDTRACVQCVRQVWEMVISRPDAYPLGLDQRLAVSLPEYFRLDGMLALCQGRFDDALTDLREARRLGDWLAGGILPVARAANTTLGHRCYRRARSFYHFASLLRRSSAHRIG